ncbi:unnamed protein product [Cyclocybe aegerita]|uniref:Uncharacterized protein n=1 Tax=Cyclocybe aegerita TaxID=1973307 RepID=A0A8S0WDW5_CYCAE|nr:unnamed protein product [Cyclocybe aegerita]
MPPSFADLFPEIFPLIVAHIPLHITPATVRSLSLTNRHVSAATLPLVWGCLVIEDERQFNNFVKKISSDLKFGHGVRELHIMLRSLSQNRFVDGSFNAVKILEESIISGALPSMHTIGLRAILSGYADECPDFWRNVKKYCPRFRRLILLDIYGTEEAMSFWTRHPTLETVAIFTREKYSRWFVDPFPQAFLPNLRHFKAHFREVRVLAQILPQLRSLAVCDSINAQVPYLLHCFLEYQKRQYRGYEAQDGTFHDGREGSIKRQGQASKRDFLKEYVHSIVRGAPNIEELCFISLPSLTDLIVMSSDFSGLKNLKRMYIEVAATYEDEVRENILANASLVLAQQSGLASLESVTNFNPEFPFPVAKIQ